MNKRNPMPVIVLDVQHPFSPSPRPVPLHKFLPVLSEDWHPMPDRRPRTVEHTIKDCQRLGIRQIRISDIIDD